MVKKGGGMDIERPPKKKRESNFGISKNTFRRLARAAGVKRVSNELLEEMPKLLESFLIKAIKELLDSRIIQ
jgi:histone H3/H4